MEVVCYHSVAAIELRNISFRRVGNSSCHKVTTREEGRAAGHNLSGEFGGQCVRVDWRGRHGVSRKRCFSREGLEARGIRAGGSEQSGEGKEELKVCVRCGMAFRDEDNSPIACKYHGHMTGKYDALCPPHSRCFCTFCSLFVNGGVGD